MRSGFMVLRLVGLLLMLFSLTMLPPMVVSWLFEENQTRPFLIGMLVCLSVGFVAWWPVKSMHHELRLRDGFLVVAIFWLVLGLFGALPLYWTDALSLSITDAVFESISGLTTTGATVITGLDTLPKAILYYRQQLQWLGGMGIIVLAVAVLPMLGVGGMQLYRAETPGPVKDNKLTPRITQTAKALWFVYLSLTIMCALAYGFAGMEAFDAICHAFSTVAIGGFSTYDASIGFFDSALIEGVCIFFMLLAGANFSLHFLAWRQISLMNYFRDPEFRTYIWLLLGLVALVFLHLMWLSPEVGYEQHLRQSAFQAVSIGTTTGFTTTSFALWGGALPVLLLLASFIGGCAGSTAGGMKVVRWILIFKQGMREVMRLIHPNAEIPVRIGKRAVPNKVIESVWGFFSVYMIVFGLMMLLLMAMGSDQVTAFSAVAASLNNLGPGLGDVADNYASLVDGSKWVAVLAMVMGRLEIFTLFVLFTPAFWRR